MITAIIPAAGKSHNQILPDSNLPDAMTPINGKPVIAYEIEDLLERGIYTITVVIREDDLVSEKYLSSRFVDKAQLTILKNPHPEKGVGYSVLLAATNPDSSYLVVLGDTIYKGAYDFSSDFLIVSSDYEESCKWCFVAESERGAQSFINKPTSAPLDAQILCGIYYFHDGSRLCEIKNLLASNASVKNIELSDILSIYNILGGAFTLRAADAWYDCGNIENYYRARIDFLKIRNFNSIEYDDLYGSITKRSSKCDKLNHEINWYLNLPDRLKLFAPRLIDYRLSTTDAYYTVEFYGYQSLADIFVFGHLNTKLWSLIIGRLFDIIDLFRAYKAELPFSNFQTIYDTKNKQRIEEVRQTAFWQELMSHQELIINGKSCKNINYYLELTSSKLDWLYTPKDIAIIHGDLCLSNILFDGGSRIFKFIDPRGSFGSVGIYGDIKYDLAKLRHSLVSGYDFIVSDSFVINQVDSTYQLNLFAEAEHAQIGVIFDQSLLDRGYDLDKIKYIEAWLFLSMLPLHSDHPERQLAMYLSGIKLLNQINL